MIKEQSQNVEKFFDSIYTLIERNKNILDNIQFLSKEEPSQFRILDTKNLPTISTTLNNKIVEIGSYYKKHDLSFYNTSPLSHIILCDLTSYVRTGFSDLKALFKFLEILTYQGPLHKYRPEVFQPLDEPLKFGNIKNYFKKKTQIKQDLLKEDSIFSTNVYFMSKDKINDYFQVDKSLFNYNLETDLSDSIVKYFMQNPSSYTKVNLQNIESEIEALELANILPNLHKVLKRDMSLEVLGGQKSNIIEPISWIKGLYKPFQDAFYQTNLPYTPAFPTANIPTLKEPKHTNSQSAPIDHKSPQLDEI